MITQLYIFSPGSYVVAEEWNANFRIIYQATYLHKEAINDAYSVVAFPDSDLSGVYAQVRARGDSDDISGQNAVDIAASHEYYKTLANGQDLVINIPQGLNSEARVLIRIQENRSLLPFSVNYSGTKIINHYNNYVFRPGYYYIMIYETNNVAQVKLIWTGV